jgi:hypothetical protein
VITAVDRAMAEARCNTSISKMEFLSASVPPAIGIARCVARLLPEVIFYLENFLGTGCLFLGIDSSGVIFSAQEVIPLKNQVE